MRFFCYKTRQSLYFCLEKIGLALLPLHFYRFGVTNFEKNYKKYLDQGLLQVWVQNPSLDLYLTRH